MNALRILAGLAVAAAWAVAPAQAPVGDTLSLDEALALARQRNGTILATDFQIRGAEQGVVRSKAAFFPTLSPTFRYDSTYTERYTGPGRNNDGGANSSSLSMTANYTLLDNGARGATLQQSRLGLSSTMLSAMETRRQVLFAVIQRYYDALRANDLLRVRKQQLERAEIILKQTVAEAAAGAIARKDVLQAEADKLNAEVAVLDAQNQIRTSEANLKAQIGWRETDGPIALEPVAVEETVAPGIPFEEVLIQGLSQRPDLRQRRVSIQSQQVAIQLSKLNAGIDYSVDAQYTRSQAPNVLDQTGLVLRASIPLFDGGLTKSSVRSAQFQLQQLQQQLDQDIRDAEAEIESAYFDYSLSSSRLRAARAAEAAARKNFDSVRAAQALNAATLPEVINAQTSLVTAESNLVQAEFDARVSRERLKLVTGQILPGEEVPAEE